MSNSMPEFDADEMSMQALAGPPLRGCPPIDVLLAYGQEVLPADVEQRLTTHMATCALCTMLIADMATLPEVPLSPAQKVKIRAGLPVAETPVVARGSRGWGTWSAIAAAVLVCVALGTVAYRKNNDVRVAVPPAASPATTVAALEIPLVPLAPPADATLVMRGAHGGDEPSVGELMPAFTAYNGHDYRGAADQFGVLRNRYPRSERVLLYLGVSQLLLHDDGAAGATLEAARGLPGARFVDAEQWYGAIAAQRLQPAEARGLLEKLCANAASAYSAESCRIVATLR